MKSLTMLLLSGLLVLVSHVFAQTIVTNRILSTEAVRIVSRLTFGMPQAEVRKALELNGFGKVGVGKVGAVTTFHGCFQQQDDLADGYALELEYMPTLRTNNILLRISTSRLQQAWILSNGVHVTSIALTNAP